MERAALFARLVRRARGERPAAFARARQVGTGLPRAGLAAADEAALWAAHAEAMARWRLVQDVPARAALPAEEADLLALKAELAGRLLGPCRLCWLRCPVDRRREQTGRCGLGAGLRVYRELVHLGEELELIPTHAVYLAGCSLRCPYCSEWDHVARPAIDPELSPSRLARALEGRRREGALTASFVGGEPTLSLPGVLAALAETGTSVPVVWNTNLTGTPEAHDLLEGVVDAWVADLKVGSEACGRPATGAAGALEVVRRNLARVDREAWTIVRHLVLPGHLACCTLPVLEWLARELPPGARVNLMPHYAPTPEVAGTAWDRRPAADELAAARARASALGLDLTGPGRIEPAAAPQAPAPGRAPPLAPFASRIRISPTGEVVIEDLDPDLLDLARVLGQSPDLDQRQAAARPWLAGPSDAAGPLPEPDDQRPAP